MGEAGRLGIVAPKNGADAERLGEGSEEVVEAPSSSAIRSSNALPPFEVVAVDERRFAFFGAEGPLASDSLSLAAAPRLPFIVAEDDMEKGETVPTGGRSGS